ncbi:uncharacterized protein EAE97_002686 [Botrytis byssoidea]|uniref:Sphingolipid long chain base-responsive protein LSP1 n=1 Tax=Botrytis byssoidea TaxID=139641 RepID=A0A9P5IV25_9HELO|nr:uncharacterized protein EAE97_002686 [Botrytis byssoidea]KAF7951135.1 hypothetical protein EAE97_002686 [Botrytis byssoidea]
MLRRANSSRGSGSGEKNNPLKHLFAPNHPWLHPRRCGIRPIFNYADRQVKMVVTNIVIIRNRALSIRSSGGKSSTKDTSSSKHFSLSSLRGINQPDLSKKLYKLIKTENNLITAYETAGRERISIASQLSEWGESTEDDAISEISDKIGVLLSELGDQEDYYAHSLDDSRGVLKAIRNTEKSVQPSRDHKHKLVEQISKLRAKEPQSATLVTLEQELVRAEAEQLVAEAQLTNITRKKIKEAYDAEFAATIERAEKQIILARHGRRLLNLLDDTPIVPGNIRPAFEHTEQARQILNDAEDDLRDWQFDEEEVQSHGNLDSGAMRQEGVEHQQVQNVEGSVVGTEDGYRNEGVQSEIGESRISSGQEIPGSYAPSAAGTSVTTGPMETNEVNRVV